MTFVLAVLATAQAVVIADAAYSGDRIAAAVAFGGFVVAVAALAHTVATGAPA